MGSQHQDRLESCVEEVVSHLAGNMHLGAHLNDLALEIIGMTSEEFERLSNEDDSDARIQLFWSTYSTLITKVFIRAADRMTHYADLSRVPFYKTFAHVSDWFKTDALGCSFTITYNVPNGSRRVVTAQLRKIDGPRNSLSFVVISGFNPGQELTIEHKYLVYAVNNGQLWNASDFESPSPQMPTAMWERD